MRFRHVVAISFVTVCAWGVNGAIPSISEYKEQLGRVIDELNRHEQWIETANEQNNLN